MDTSKRVGNGRPGLFLLWKEGQTRKGVAAQEMESGIRGGRGHDRNIHVSWEPSRLSAVSWLGPISHHKKQAAVRCLAAGVSLCPGVSSPRERPNEDPWFRGALCTAWCPL